MSESILTPVGRLVQGDVFEPETKDMDNKPLLAKSGPNIGQPTVKYNMTLAIPKTDPAWPDLEAKIKAEAAVSFPNLFPGGQCIQPTFAFKISDGDSIVPNAKGNRNCDKEGFPGHWILRFSSGYVSKVVTSTQPMTQIIDPKAIKRGDYIRISGTVVGNGSELKPGVFLNHSMVQFIGHGEAITSGPSAEQVFGTEAIALPPGASATPLASAPMPAPVAPVPAQPDYTFLQPPTPVAPVAAERSFKVGDAVWTESQLLASKWTQEAINALPPA